MSPNEYPNSESEWTAVFTGVSREWMNQCAGMILSVTPSAVHLLRIETHPMNQIWAWLVFLHSSEVLEFTLKNKVYKRRFLQGCHEEPFLDPQRTIHWRDIRPSMVTHTRNLCSAFNPSKVHTHSSEHTHTRSSGQPFMLRRPGSSWGFGALLKGLTSVVVLRVERVLHIHSPHLQFLPARDSNSQPFDYESDSLTIRPRLPTTVQWTVLKWTILVKRIIAVLYGLSPTVRHACDFADYLQDITIIEWKLIICMHFVCASLQIQAQEEAKEKLFRYLCAVFYALRDTFYTTEKEIRCVSLY